MQAFFREYKQLIRIAAPLMFIQLCQASLGLVDTLLAGQYHYIDLAAVGLGGVLWNAVLIFLTGMLFVLVPKYAERSQKNDIKASRDLYAIASKAADILSFFGFALVHLLAFVIGYFVSDVALALIAKNYLHCVAFGMPALVFIAKLRYLGEGHKRLFALMTISVLLLIVNFLLSFFLVFGCFGLPEMGGMGCGLGTTLSAYIVAFILYLIMKHDFSEVVLTRKQVKKLGLSGFKVKVLLLEGLPIGFALVLQILALALIAFSAEKLGVKHIGAHQIMITIAMCFVMIPLAMGNASTIQIASYVSTGDKQAVRYVIRSAFVTLIFYVVFTLGILLSVYPRLISLFTRDVQILHLALSSVVPFVLFLVFDSVQMALAGILRGFQDFIRPLAAILLAYWLVILPTLFLFGRWWISMDSIASIWYVMALGLFCAITFLIYALVSKRKVVSY